MAFSEGSAVWGDFSCMFLNPNIFFPNWIIILLIHYIWETSRKKLKKHSVTKNCSDLSLFEQIVLVISKTLQILGLQPRISKVFSRSLEQFFPTVSQNNFGNKIPILLQKKLFQPIVWRDGSTFGQMLEEEVFLRLSILETGLGWFINFKRQYFAEIWCGYRVATKNS